ncbi:MAG: FtsH protease activity modulator HflK [Clostridiales bacterium]|nr:FtsH protease activity modulator HflK [Clostridiales bacterium]
MKLTGRIVIAVIVVVFLAIIGFSSWFTVNDQQQAVVTTFGKATRVCDAGIHFKIPFIQRVHKVDVNVRQRMELGYRTDKNGNIIKLVEDESKMITGDFNIVNIDFFIDYRITDPIKYLFNSTEPETILMNLLQSQVRNVVGSTNVDNVLTHGRNAIQSTVKELTVQELEKYDIVLSLYNVTIQDSEPPNEEVSIAFKNVQTASQLAEKVINEARAYENAKIPNAQADANKLINNAEYLKTNRINEAKMQIAMFEAIYQEYSINPHITKTRMYYEMIKEVLPGVKIYIDVTENGDTLKFLPLDDLSK